MPIKTICHPPGPVLLRPQLGYERHSGSALYNSSQMALADWVCVSDELQEIEFEERIARGGEDWYNKVNPL